MTHRNSTLALALLLSISASTVSAQATNTRRGAVLGGLGGAAVGAIIGENNDEAGAGAAIGGVLGAIAGGALGADSPAYRRYPAAPSIPVPPAVPIPVQRTVSTADIIAMTHSRVSDTVIITAIRNNGIERPIDVPDIVYLSQQGVSDPVIRAMQSAGTAPLIVSKPVPAPRLPAPRHVIVDHFPVHRGYHHPRHRPHVNYHYNVGRRRPSSGVNISFGHRF